jgi:hypothetical protein
MKRDPTTIMSRRALIGGIGSLALIATSRAASDPGQAAAPATAPAPPFPTIQVVRSEALAEWERLRALDNGYPVLVGDQEELATLGELSSFADRTPDDILAAAARLEHPASIVALRNAEVEQARDYMSRSGLQFADSYAPPDSEWPDASRIPRASGPSVMEAGKPTDRINLLLVPASNMYEVPAHLGLGGWNDCPAAEYHVAAMRYWHGRYGAELVTVSGDVVELRVARRPTSRQEALELAREQYHYCPDIVEQGTESISGLAAMLMASDWWYFWWD